MHCLKGLIAYVFLETTHMKITKSIMLILTALSVINILTSTIPLATEEHLCSDEWTGRIRIEGKEETIFDGVVTISDTTIIAKNKDTGEIEEYILDFPNPLGALNEASIQGEFSYSLTYYPEWEAFLIDTIESDSDWWHYLIDYSIPMIGAGNYKLTEEDNEILWGYLENWYVHTLKISIDKTEIKKNEEITIQITNELDETVENAIVYLNEETYLTDVDGSVTITISEEGSYQVYAEKEDNIRSEEISIQVKKSKEIQYPFLTRLLSIDFIEVLFEKIISLHFKI